MKLVDINNYKSRPAPVRDFKFILFLAFYVLLFSNYPKYGIYAQVLSVSLLLLQNLITTISPKNKHYKFVNKNPSCMAALLIFVLPLQSIFIIFFTPQLKNVEYSIVFLIVILSIYFTTNTIDFRIIFNSFMAAAIAMIVTIAVFESEDLGSALNVTIDTVDGLERFSPFELHPNLLAHMVGGFSVAFFGWALFERNLMYKIAATMCFIQAAVFCIATSSRGGLLASLLGIFSICALTAWKDKKKRYLLISSVVIGSLFFLIYDFQRISVYMASILELESSHRGLDTGFTGRVDNWAKLINTAFSTTPSLLLGHGLRTGGAEELGYDIDNSYLNLLYEVGIISLTAFISLLVITVNRLRKAYLSSRSEMVIIVFGMFVFIIAESIVARYLLSIGNPVSLLLIFCMLGARSLIKSELPGSRFYFPIVYHQNLNVQATQRT